MSRNNLVSVGVITYNRPHLLREAVKSVLKQSFTNFELIISNDNPETKISSSSLEIEYDPRIRIINQVFNLGVLGNMNYLLEVATGEWFVWLSEDDLLHPDYLTFAVDAVFNPELRNPVAYFSNYCSAASPAGIFPIPVISPVHTVYSETMGVEDFLFQYTLRRYPCVGECGLFHIETLRKAGGIPRLGTGPGHYSDTLLPILMLEHGSILWADYPFVFFRADPDSISHSSNDFYAYASAEIDFLFKLEKVCMSQSVNVVSDKLVANMIRWFSAVEWQVLLRSTSVSKFSLLCKFLKYQVNVNLPKLRLRYKIRHIIYVLFRAAFVAINSIKGSSEPFSS